MYRPCINQGLWSLMLLVTTNLDFNVTILFWISKISFLDISNKTPFGIISDIRNNYFGYPKKICRISEITILDI